MRKPSHRHLEAVKSSAGSNSSPNVSYLDQTLWTQFQNAESESEFAQSWLTLQCSMIANIRLGTFILKGKSNYTPVGIWPNDEAPTKRLVQAGVLAVEQNKGVVRTNRVKDEDGIEESFHLAYPIHIDEHIYGIAVVEVPLSSKAQLSAIMRQLQWGASWFETYHRRNLPSTLTSKNEKLSKVIELINTALEQDNFTASAASVSTDIAAFLQCERVSIGFRKGSNIHVAALSNTAQFDKKTNIVRAMGVAMDEAADQSASVAYPNRDGGSTVSRAQEELITLSGSKSICTVPFSKDGKIIGAITAEHAGPDHFGQENIELLEHITLLVGPLLTIQKSESQWFHSRIWTSTKNLLSNVFGNRFLTAKLVALLAVLILGYLYQGTGLYRVSADATLEGWKQRKVSAPIDGYISTAHARAGDIVQKGQLLFVLENKDIQLEYDKWVNQKAQVESKYSDAFVKHDKTKVGMLKAQLRQADAQIALVKGQLDRTQVIAPFSGVLVLGDLSQMLGAPVEKGQVLMEIAPLDDYRIIVDVDEKDIADIQSEQRGVLTLASMPGEEFEFSISKVTPVSQSGDGKNTFRVEAKLLEQAPLLRPGMQGTGKIAVEDRNLLWIWSHSLTDWVRLWLWKWWP